MIERILSFLKGWQRLTRTVESLLIDNLSSSAPWLAPLIPAYLVFNSMIHVLAFPVWVAIAGAATVEVVGLSAVSTTFQLWDYNDSKRQTDQYAPVLLALLTSIFYLCIVLIVNVLLDNAPLIHKAAKALLSLLSVCAVIILALRAGHSRRLEKIDQEKAERKAARQERNVQPAAGAMSAKVPMISQQELTPLMAHQLLKGKYDWRTLSDADRERVKGMNTWDIVTAFGVSDRTARQWRQFSKRGNGKEQRESASMS